MFADSLVVVSGLVWLEMSYTFFLPPASLGTPL
jgi:hypothetical protein